MTLDHNIYTSIPWLLVTALLVSTLIVTVARAIRATLRGRKTARRG